MDEKCYNCTEKIMKSGLRVAIKKLDNIRTFKRKWEARKFILCIAEMLEAYKCVSVECLINRCNIIANQIEDSNQYVHSDSVTDALIKMLLEELRTFCQA